MIIKSAWVLSKYNVFPGLDLMFLVYALVSVVRKEFIVAANIIISMNSRTFAGVQPRFGFLSILTEYDNLYSLTRHKHFCLSHS